MSKQTRHGNPHAPTDTRWGKKVLALFLSVVMCLSMLPAGAFAAENNSTNEHEHTSHNGDWTALTTATYGTAIQSKIYNPQAKQDEGESPYPAGTYRFYLDEDIEPENSSSYIVSARAGQHIIICMNGHTLKGYTANELALFRAEPGGTVTFCDCVGTGAIVAKVNPNEPTQTGGVVEVVDSNTWLTEKLEGGIVNLYGGTLKSENPNSPAIRAEYHKDYSNDYNAGHIDIYGGAVVSQSGQAAIAADCHAILTIAGGSSITGDVYALDMTIGTAGGERVTIDGVLKGTTEEPTTIRSLVNADIKELEANAAYNNNPIENCIIEKISGSANVTIKDSTILGGTLNINENGQPENRDITIINSNMHDTEVGGRNITITNTTGENYTVGSVKASEFYIWQPETVERSTVM